MSFIGEFKVMRISLVALVLALSTTSVAFAQSGAVQKVDKAAAEQKQRYDLVYKIVREWGPYVESIHEQDIRRWADRMVPTFRKAGTERLEAAARANTFEEMTNALLGQHSPSAKDMPGGKAAASIGALAADLSFTPLNSCILLDTRRAGGMMQSGTTRNFRGAGESFTNQGGSNTNCAIPFSPAALLVSVAAISPASAGYLTLWPYGEIRPTASNISFSTNQNIQNEIVLRTRQGLTSDFSIYAEGRSHVVVNVLGYFMAPEPTALQCKYSQDSDVTDSSKYLMLHPSNCEVGYTPISVECREGSPTATLAGTYGGACTFVNPAGTSVTYSARRQCCRVPGR